MGASLLKPKPPLNPFITIKNSVLGVNTIASLVQKKSYLEPFASMGALTPTPMTIPTPLSKKTAVSNQRLIQSLSYHPHLPKILQLKFYIISKLL